jgi:hypothetical protein
MSFCRSTSIVRKRFVAWLSVRTNEQASTARQAREARQKCAAARVRDFGVLDISFLTAAYLIARD